jgi:transposase-like protein
VIKWVSIDQLYLIFSNRRIFPRRRIDPYIKAIAVKAYTLGLSLAQVKEFLKEKGYNISREAIRKWFLKAGEIISNIKKIKKKRGFIAADETIVFNLKKKAYLLAAREIKNKEIIAFTYY